MGNLDSTAKPFLLPKKIQSGEVKRLGQSHTTDPGSDPGPQQALDSEFPVLYRAGLWSGFGKKIWAQFPAHSRTQNRIESTTVHIVVTARTACSLGHFHVRLSHWGPVNYLAVRTHRGAGGHAARCGTGPALLLHPYPQVGAERLQSSRHFPPTAQLSEWPLRVQACVPRQRGTEKPDEQGRLAGSVS